MSGPSRLGRLPRTYLPPLAGTQTPFALAAASLFALLYTETGAYSVRVAGTRGQQESAALLIIAGIVVFGGCLLSLVLPPKTQHLPEGDFADARPVFNALFDQLRTGVLIFVATSASALAMYVWLVWPDVVAIYNLVKDAFIYTMVAVIYYHCMVTYVRYLTYLYRTKMDSAPKIAIVEVSLGLLTLILGLYLLTLDVVSLMSVSDPSGIMGLHITVRDIWMTVVVLFAYGWHLRYLADH